MLKTLIAYGTKYGSTAACAWKLGKLIREDVNIVDLAEDPVPRLERFDQIIIGSPVYVGEVREEVTDFCQKELDLLLERQTGIFICGWSVGNIEDKAKELFPGSLVEESVVGYFGGQIEINKLDAIEKLFIEKALESQEPPQILDRNITKFAEHLSLLHER